MQGPQADRRFAPLARNFVTAENPDGFSTPKRGLHTDTVYVLFLDPTGVEISRLRKPCIEEVFQEMDRVLRITAYHRRGFAEFAICPPSLTSGQRQEVERLVERLYDPSLEAREEATTQLLGLGPVAWVILEKLGPLQDPEVQARVDFILFQMRPVADAVRRLHLDRDIDFLLKIARGADRELGDRARRRLREFEEGKD